MKKTDRLKTCEIFSPLPGEKIPTHNKFSRALFARSPNEPEEKHQEKWPWTWKWKLFSTASHTGENEWEDGSALGARWKETENVCPRRRGRWRGKHEMTFRFPLAFDRRKMRVGDAGFFLEGIPLPWTMSGLYDSGKCVVLGTLMMMSHLVHYLQLLFFMWVTVHFQITEAKVSFEFAEIFIFWFVQLVYKTFGWGHSFLHCNINFKSQFSFFQCFR